MDKSAKKRKFFQRKWSALEICVCLILTVYSLALIALFAWAIMTSFKTQGAYDRDKLFFNTPNAFTFDNYLNVFNGMSSQVPTLEGGMRPVYIEEMFLYSFLYAGGCAFCQTFFTATVAYCTARYKGTVASVIHSIVIITLILPVVGSLASTLQMAYELNLVNNMLGMYVLKVSFNNMYYLIFYALFASMSWEYAESAFIDGASHFTVYFKIMFPLAATLFGTVFLLFFISYWNDYQVPLMFLRNMPTLALGLYGFMLHDHSEFATPTAKIAAGVCVFIPVFAVFVAFRNKIMGNLTEGGIKG